MTVPALELDLEVFTGPFDLLLALVLREEVDLLELALADVVLSYLDFLESRGELDLESATEFIVLIAALLELKSRLLLDADDDALADIEPGKAAEELLERMLQARRYRGAAGHLGERLESLQGIRYRSVALPVHLRRVVAVPQDASEDPATLGAAIGDLLRVPQPINVSHITVARVTVAERLAHLRRLLARGSFHFDEAVREADRLTVAITLYALLELYKRGEADWEQPEPFADIVVTRTSAVARGAAAGRGAVNGEPTPQDHGEPVPQDAYQAVRPDAGEAVPQDAGEAAPQDTGELVRIVEALLFLSSEPLTLRELAEATDSDHDEVLAALAALGESCASGRRGLLLREVAGGYTLATDPAVAEPAARRLFSRPRVASLTPAQAETLAIVAYLQPVSRPEIARIRGVSAESAVTTLLDRGLIEESGRSQFGAALYRTTALFLKLFGLRSLDELPDVAQWDPTPEEQAELRERLMRAGEARAGAGGAG